VISRRVFSSVWVALDERLNVEGKNYLQGGEGPVQRRQVLDDSTKATAGQEWRRDSQK